jgi:hypothetical protein
MQHWYAYHSEKTMGHVYSSLPGSRMYVTQVPKQLEVGDWIWVIEGDARPTRRYTLVDCFEIAEIDRGPFGGAFARFGGKAVGQSSRLRFPAGLNRADAWFADLHGQFITKQKFFSRLADRPDIVKGLELAGGMTP